MSGRYSKTPASIWMITLLSALCLIFSYSAFQYIYNPGIGSGYTAIYKAGEEISSRNLRHLLNFSDITVIARAQNESQAFVYDPGARLLKSSAAIGSFPKDRYFSIEDYHSKNDRKVKVKPAEEDNIFGQDVSKNVSFENALLPHQELQDAGISELSNLFVKGIQKGDLIYLDTGTEKAFEQVNGFFTLFNAKNGMAHAIFSNPARLLKEMMQWQPSSFFLHMYCGMVLLYAGIQILSCLKKTQAHFTLSALVPGMIFFAAVSLYYFYKEAGAFSFLIAAAGIFPFVLATMIRYILNRNLQKKDENAAASIGAALTAAGSALMIPSVFSEFYVYAVNAGHGFTYYSGHGTLIALTALILAAWTIRITFEKECWKKPVFWRVFTLMSVSINVLTVSQAYTLYTLFFCILCSALFAAFAFVLPFFCRVFQKHSPGNLMELPAE